MGIRSFGWMLVGGRAGAGRVRQRFADRAVRLSGPRTSWSARGTRRSPGDTLTVHYIGTLENGQVFDSSYDRGQPFTFRLGARTVIQGWDQGLVGMRVGGKRRLTIPPALAYGSQGSAAVHPRERDPASSRSS